MSTQTKNPATDSDPTRRVRGTEGYVSERPRERAVLVHIHFPRARDADALDELRLLVSSAGGEVCGCVTGRRRTPDAATYVGRGKAVEIRTEVAQRGADLVVVDHAISPVQERNLERLLGCRVLDRTALILDIFAQRAKSHEGKLQVELAQLRHLSTRLVRGWTHLERQKGGIGLRGPGETQLETDRRLIAARIKSLQKRLQRVHTQRRQRRRVRERVPVTTVALVGYTNAGKSSLFNRLTHAGVREAEQLFATLDPTARRLQVPGFGHVVFTDTVGFIRRLPHSLVESFRSTLDEVASAALLVHVIDATNPKRRECAAQVDRVLEEIGAAHVPRILVFNKIDLLGRPASFERGTTPKVWLSAKTGEGLELLLYAIAEHFRRNRYLCRLRVPASAAALRARIYRRGAVLRETVTDTGDWIMDVELESSELSWLERQRGAGVTVSAAAASAVACPGVSP